MRLSFEVSDNCVIGWDNDLPISQDQKVFFWFDSSHFNREKKLAEIEAMTPAKRIDMVLEQKSQDLWAAHNEEANRLRTEADVKTEEHRRLTQAKIDTMFDAACESNPEYKAFKLALE